MILEKKSFTKIFDYGGQNVPLVITPPNIFQPTIGVGRGVGAPLKGPLNIHFMGSQESVKILGVQGILAE